MKTASAGRGARCKTAGFGLLTLLLGCLSANAHAAAAIKVQPGDIFGLQTIKCWFEIPAHWPATRCYNMRVPENHAAPDGRVISFPVMVFRSPGDGRPKSPLLHLGGGGPGQPMYLDALEAMEFFLEAHDDMSLKLGRDLIVIDPRGSGLSHPLLTCNTLVDNMEERLSRNLTMAQEWQSIDRDYRHCIEQFARQGVDFRSYNSYSIALDVELLRRSLKIDRWTLVGVSYATIYAQMLAREFPASVESMILDSAIFPNLAEHEIFLLRGLGAYQALLNYCDYDPACEQPLADFERRFWKLYHELNREPITITLKHPGEYRGIKLVLNGERLLATLLEGVYGVQIFRELPRIVADLEQRHYEYLLPYLRSSLLYWFDRSYGDVSAEAHYCFDSRPYTDFERIKAEVDNMPDGPLKTFTQFGLEQDDYCGAMKIETGYPSMAEAQSIEIPTLFLQGELDSITPIASVETQLENFSAGHLLRYRLSHSILGSDECAEITAARFITNPAIATGELHCF